MPNATTRIAVRSNYWVVVNERRGYVNRNGRSMRRTKCKWRAPPIHTVLLSSKKKEKRKNNSTCKQKLITKSQKRQDSISKHLTISFFLSTLIISFTILILVIHARFFSYIAIRDLIYLVGIITFLVLRSVKATSMEKDPNWMSLTKQMKHLIAFLKQIS